MKKYLSLFLILILVLTGCNEKAETPKASADTAEKGYLRGVVTVISKDPEDPYLEIQWTNYFNESVTIEENGKMHKRVGNTWVEINELEKYNSNGDKITIGGRGKFVIVRYKVANLENYGEGRYLARVASVDKKDSKQAEAEFFVSEKEVLSTSKPKKTVSASSEPTPTPKPEIEYIGTPACPVNKSTFDMYTNITTNSDQYMNIEIVELEYGRVEKDGKVMSAPRWWTVRVTNKNGADVIIKSATMYHSELGSSTNSVSNRTEKRIKHGYAADITVYGFSEAAPSGAYEIRVEYMDLDNATNTLKVNLELPEKYAGENFPAPVPTWKPGATGKPVIYLYPQADIDVTVKLDYDGLLKYTYPKYNDGWHVRAKKDGTIINYEDNQEYSYLFWEGYDNLDCDFTKGFCVKGSDTAEFLQKALKEIGLTPREYNEFIVYWLPQMQDNPYNIISFQYENYSEMAKLQIDPAPDSLLRVFMAFKPSSEYVEMEPQQLEGFDRNGFTVVEWGGKQAD